MKLTWHSLAGAAKILIDPFLSDNPSWLLRKQVPKLQRSSLDQSQTANPD